MLEIGTGWGGFAVHAAATRGCRVTTTTISREQHAYALATRARGRAARTASRSCSTTTATCAGSYDKLVSIEMIEAVGWKDFGTFFERCSRPARARRRDAAAGDHRSTTAPTTSRRRRAVVHPHADLPQRLPAVARGDRPLRRARHRPAHGRTSRTSRRTTPRRCGAGAANFDAAHDRLDALGYDERFRRLWRLYLAYCEAGFAERRIGLVQTVLAKPHWRPAELCRGRRPARRPHGDGRLMAALSPKGAAIGVAAFCASPTASR